MASLLGFSLSDEKLAMLLWVEYLIVFMFVVEYFPGFILSDNKSLFVTSPQGIIGALIVIFATVSLFQITPDFFSVRQF
ncbi:MAG: hypothetical protein ACI8Z1_000996 [Candidatus Azotimanducaceae bacterium]|jgi:hypothetical protein